MPKQIRAASDCQRDGPISEPAADHLAAAYAEMGADEARESAALPWSEALVGDVADTPR
ncbi:hypothetical protein [Candidatus Spongiisocius sp.]|uniref:hypothetical protein n=1 Tax=Candidatus Spongiisocius sp. TaxID=3101273 RepID=UPI003B5B60D7